ncbi:MAG: carbohydrate ABC transporter substrate-binding protein [Clostridia bacterium]|nr:carbohydrate ABC transporter substrate-binding protein [Clostridia bacterium]
MKKLLCTVLVLLFVLGAFASCAVENGPKDTQTNGPETTGDTATETEVPPEELTNLDKAKPYLDKLPQTNYKRTFNVLCMAGIGNSEKEIWAEQASSEAIEDAVFNRNTAMYDTFGVTITKTPSATVSTTAQNDIKANAQSYDLIMANGPETGALAQNGYLYNFLDLGEYMNLDKEWWDPGTLRDCAINGKVYFMNGDINILDNDVTWIMLFNKKMIADNDLEEPYELVKAGTWTLDKFYEYVKTVSKENGDGKYDENDTYGFLTTNGGGLTNFLYTCDVKTVDFVDGTPQVVMGNYQEKIIDILAYCKKLMHEDNVTWVSQNNPEQTKNMFMNNQGLFYSEVLSYIVNLADMDSPYGVLPTPKYDEKQENYRTHVDGVGSMISIPSNVKNPVDTAYIVEAFALYSYAYLTPAYYEVTLKRKKSRDADSAEMIDIILQSRVYDIGYIYQTIGLANVFNGLVSKGSTDFASSYKSKSKSAEKNLAAIMKRYNKI